MYKIEFSNRAEKSLRRIPKKWRKRILTGILVLEKNPFLGKKLEGDLSGYYSIRIWPYRVVYEIRKKELIIFIVDLGHRQSIYG